MAGNSDDKTNLQVEAAKLAVSEAVAPSYVRPSPLPRLEREGPWGMGRPMPFSPRQG